MNEPKFDHTVGSHSDDRGGDSDRRCACQDTPNQDNTGGGDELRKEIAELFDQFGYVVSCNKLYSASAEMNAEIVQATDSAMLSIQAHHKPQPTADAGELDDKLRVIHNRFHGRFETHAKVAKHARWTREELENVQIEDEWLMYQEIKQLFQHQADQLVKEGRQALQFTLANQRAKLRRECEGEVVKARIDELQHVSRDRTTNTIVSMQPYKDGVMMVTIEERIDQLTKQHTAQEDNV